MAELKPGQIEVGGLVMGRGCDIKVSSFEPGGKPDATTHDRPFAAVDGRAFGIDTLTGRTIAMTLFVDTRDPVAAAKAYSRLAAIWNDPSLRLVDGAFTSLRYRPPYGHLPGRIVYGRPRKFDPENEHLLRAGRVDIVADFDCVDGLFYVDPESIAPIVIPITPPIVGRATFPLTFPLVFSTTSSGFGEFVVGGTEVTPLVARVNGPITNPLLDYLGYWKAQVRTTLLYDQWLDIDARPHVRTVVRSDGLNLSGVLDGPPLSDLILYPGPGEMVLRGTDPTGTASVTLTPQGASSVPYFV